jgi:thioredoxin reductase (NADPH)
MAAHHTKFIRGAIPTKLEKPDPNGRVKVTWQSGNSEVSDEFDTVLFAIGRYALTAGLNLEKAGLKCEKNGKFIVNEYEQTNISNIFAIGDI